MSELCGCNKTLPEKTHEHKPGGCLSLAIIEPEGPPPSDPVWSVWADRGLDDYERSMGW